MLDSLVFGAWYHFVVESPDHVMHVPPGGWGTVFQATAVALFATEAAGTWVGWAIRARARPGATGIGAARARGTS